MEHNRQKYIKHILLWEWNSSEEIVIIIFRNDASGSKMVKRQAETPTKSYTFALRPGNIRTDFHGR